MDCVSSKKFFILSLFLSFFFSRTEGVVIVTHGFNAYNEPWYQPGGDFYEELKTEAAKNGHSIMSFGWNQEINFSAGSSKFFKGLGFTDQEHCIAGLKLAKQITDFCNNYTYNPQYPNDATIIVVAHSFGGKVAYYASQSLAGINKKWTPKEIKTDSSYKSYLNLCYLKIKEKFGSKELLMPKPVIAALFTLGTPHWEPEKAPNPNGVIDLLNIYCIGDHVAHPITAGSPLLTEETQKVFSSAYNVYLLGVNNKGIVEGLSHSKIHSTGVARTLFDIDKRVKSHRAQKQKLGEINHKHIVHAISVE